MFELSKNEMENWRCQFGTSNGVKMGLKDEFKNLKSQFVISS